MIQGWTQLHSKGIPDYNPEWQPGSNKGIYHQTMACLGQTRLGYQRSCNSH